MASPADKSEYMLPLKETSHGTTIAVQVVPRSRKSEIAGVVNNVLRVRLTAPPVDGKANEECLRFFSELLGIPRTRLSIVSGRASRKKTLFVSGIAAEDLAVKLPAVFGPTHSAELFDNMD